MAEFPALPLFTDAYLADTRHLTTLQHGAYLLLLMTAWRTKTCSLPHDDVLLARFCGLDKRTWLTNKDAILSFWHIRDDGQIEQKRLKDERNFAADVSRRNAAAGKASALAKLLRRLNRDSTTVVTETQQNLNGNSTPLPSPSPIEEKNKLKLIPKEVSVSLEKVRGSRVPEDFTPDASCRELSSKLGFTDEEFKSVQDNFMDYWRSVPGAKGRKLNWQSTFRNKLRYDWERKPNVRSREIHKSNTIPGGFAIVDAELEQIRRRVEAGKAGKGEEDGGKDFGPLSGLLQVKSLVYSGNN